MLASAQRSDRVTLERVVTTPGSTTKNRKTDGLTD
jgi:hypothetical protein